MFNRYNIENLKRAINDPSLIADELFRPVQPFKRFGMYGLPLMASETVHRHFVSGQEPTSIWDREWDLLIVLDACRAGWLSAVSAEYQILSEVGSIYSVGSHSAEWINNTFSERYEEQIQNCTYVTANHHSKWMNPDRFARFEDVTNYEADGKPLPAPPAHVVSDQAIRVGRNMNWDKMIVHYMQPHIPFIRHTGDNYKKIFSQVDGSRRNKHDDHSVDIYEFDLLRRGEIDFDTFWKAYKETLITVLDDLKTLLTSIDAEKVVISADHGNAVGEFGIYGHKNVALPAIREVPWCETSATNTEEYTPTTEKRGHQEVSIDKRLENLGYM